MRVRTDKGITECYLDDFAAIEPEVLKIQSDYQCGRIDRTGVQMACRRLFGKARVDADWKDGWTHVEFEAWLADKPNEFRLRYYDADVVAGCIMGDEA